MSRKLMNELERRKEKLLRVERSLKYFIATDSSILEMELKKYLKAGVIVGSSLLVGYTIYKILENKNSPEKEILGSSPISSGLTYSLKSRIWAVIFTLLSNEFSKRLQSSKKEVKKSLNGDE